jgi:RNA polymerase sigma factor (sigma-70 family)
MILTGRGDLSSRLNAMYADPGRDELAFWKLLRSYVSRVCNALVDQQSLDDLTQDALIQIFKSMPKFRPDPEHNGTSFSRWVVGICKRRALDLVRARYRDRHVPASQFSLRKDHEDGFEPFDVTTLEAKITPERYFETLDSELLPARVASALDRLRGWLAAKHWPLFDLLRSGVRVSDAARRLHIKPNTAYARVKAWQKVARDHDINPEEVLNVMQKAA